MAKSSKKSVKGSKVAKSPVPLLTEQLTLDQHDFMRAEAFKGNAMLAFNQGPADEYAFSFGSAKAARLLAAFAEYGEEYVIGELVKLAGDKLAPIHKSKLGHYGA